MKTRNKLMAAAVMLVISILMMSTASFAWFSISTAPEIKAIKGNVAANQNLEIALAAGKTPAPSTVEDGKATTTLAKNMTWGNLVDLSSVENLTLQPLDLSDDGTTLSYPTYGADGRISALTAVTPSLDATSGLHLYKVGDKVWGVRIDLWLRTNVQGKISLGTAADRGTNAGTDSMGGGSTFETNTGVAITNEAIQIKYWVGNPLATTPTAAGNDTRSPAFTNEVTNTNGVLTADIISSATANAIYPVSFLLYIDGDTVTNEHMAEAISFVLNLQFDHAQNLDPMDSGLSAAD